MEKYSKALFGTAIEIKEQTRNPRLIARRVSEFEISKRNNAKLAKKQQINSKQVLNRNNLKHMG